MTNKDLKKSLEKKINEAEVRLMVCEEKIDYYRKNRDEVTKLLIELNNKLIKL